MRRSFPWLAFLAVVLFAGCAGVPASIGEAEKTPEAVEARAIVDALLRGDVAAISPRLDASLPADTAAQLTTAADFFSKESPTRVRLVVFQTNVVNPLDGAKVATTAVTHELNFSAVNSLVTVTLRTVGLGARSVVGINVQPIPAPLDVMNKFSFAGKGALHYLFLALMVAVTAVMLTALRGWVRGRKTLRRRWWWLLGILVGAFQINLNWMSGQVSVEAIRIQLFNLAFSANGPVILTFSIPAGAIAFLILQRRAGREAPQATPAG